jgi:hypothetical protein
MSLANANANATAATNNSTATNLVSKFHTHRTPKPPSSKANIQNAIDSQPK